MIFFDEEIDIIKYVFHLIHITSKIEITIFVKNKNGLVINLWLKIHFSIIDYALAVFALAVIM